MFPSESTLILGFVTLSSLVLKGLPYPTSIASDKVAMINTKTNNNDTFLFKFLFISFPLY